ncbi:uncharacterized protein L969DRAFT_102533 [Mixia osmundae IAM 14324]|uniref:SEC7 domain-containing protein n=1 Tax=Mixia osmundae (strain CBS 9802 / IAM 14324 / JCM 22182 / KY 12970) TaxID=764103 RepID=G7DUH5_MIXOS|nr:uncharacterized protein L969DRAFT_102533 [Mixia osmundae IAM 14324]KEI41108.1 hypothetical protein L969DRAFT_102533 [Mixia osmundae IAM 14324]GAA94235.1 hypothetical protein E5Q_00884 [Mixia osmundae IAM 14324]
MASSSSLSVSADPGTQRADAIRSLARATSQRSLAGRTRNNFPQEPGIMSTPSSSPITGDHGQNERADHRRGVSEERSVARMHLMRTLPIRSTDAVPNPQVDTVQARTRRSRSGSMPLDPRPNTASEINECGRDLETLADRPSSVEPTQGLRPFFTRSTESMRSYRTAKGSDGTLSRRCSLDERNERGLLPLLTAAKASSHLVSPTELIGRQPSPLGSHGYIDPRESFVSSIVSTADGGRSDRDRESAIAKLDAEDSFEYEHLMLAGRASHLAQTSPPDSHAIHNDEAHSNDGADEDRHASKEQASIASTAPVRQQTQSQPSNQAREAVLNRLKLLTHRALPDREKIGRIDLSKPKRTLQLHSGALQVVNANVVKDRYLLLFDDLLVIAKPDIRRHADSGMPLFPTLDTVFAVKSIVEVDRIRITAQREDDVSEDLQPGKRQHPMILSFIERFAEDPALAVKTLVQKGGLASDAPTIANLLFRTPELSRTQLGTYLSHRESRQILRSYVDRFHFAGIQLDDALRLIMSTLRLPNDVNAAEQLLHVFAARWAAANPSLGDSKLVGRFVIAIMELNDALHSGKYDFEGTGCLFSFPNEAITRDDFVAAFRGTDAQFRASNDMLDRVYSSIKAERMISASDNSAYANAPDLPAILTPARLPSRLHYQQASQVFQISIPDPDPEFSIKLLAQDLTFEPAVLTFATSSTASFRVTGTTVGRATMLLLKSGNNAPFYHGLPVSKTFVVERAFMRHIFQVAFINHLGIKRKYMFSMGTAEARSQWLDGLSRCASSPSMIYTDAALSLAAHRVALQVLRDSLIMPDPIQSLRGSSRAMTIGMSHQTSSSPTMDNRFDMSRKPSQPLSKLTRSPSFSLLYSYGAGAVEQLGSMNFASTNIPPPDTAASDNVSPAFARQHTGHELVQILQQNSLLPVVLGFMRKMLPETDDK